MKSTQQLEHELAAHQHGQYRRTEAWSAQKRGKSTPPVERSPQKGPDKIYDRSRKRVKAKPVRASRNPRGGRGRGSHTLSDSTLKAVAVATLAPERTRALKKKTRTTNATPTEPPPESKKVQNTLDVFRKVYGQNTKGVSVVPMEPMSDAVKKKRAKARRGKSAPPVRDRGRFYVPPLATDFEISLKVARTMARDGEISLADSLAATRMLLQKDNLILGALNIAPEEAVFSEDIEDRPGEKERMARFMANQKAVLSKVRDKLISSDSAS